MTQARLCYARFESDRDALLGAVSPSPCPADAVEAILQALEYKVAFRPLPEKVWAAVDPWERVIWQCSKLKEKLKYPAALSAARTFSLAHELAHVRLHEQLIMDGRLTWREEREADIYAALFLMPAWLIRSQDAFYDLALRVCTGERGPRLWLPVEQLAVSLKVSQQAMGRRLDELGIVKLNRKTRELQAA